MRSLSQTTHDFANAIAELNIANRLTGIWDNRRFNHCKKPVEKTSHEFIYLTEKNSRKNVELRAKYRTQIDQCIQDLTKHL